MVGLTVGGIADSGAATHLDAAGPTSQTQTALRVPVTGSGGFNYTQGSYLEGFEFALKRAIVVTSLGAYDSNLSKLPNGSENFASVPVALYDLTTHRLLASVTVGATSRAVGVYRYVTLAHSVVLRGSDRYTVAWVSLSDHYVASPKLRASAVNPAIRYLAMDGNGPGGLSQVTTMVEPNWFYTFAAHGLAALNYDLGPNFLFHLR